VGAPRPRRTRGGKAVGIRLRRAFPAERTDALPRRTEKRTLEPMASPKVQRVPVVGFTFFETEKGNKPVRDWLVSLPDGASRVIGADIWTVQCTWPIGLPLVGGITGEIKEIRSTHNDIEYRVLFIMRVGIMHALHGFVKKDKSTPKHEIDVAEARLSIMNARIASSKKKTKKVGKKTGKKRRD
jgi:phage-related protein